MEIVSYPASSVTSYVSWVLEPVRPKGSCNKKGKKSPTTTITIEGKLFTPEEGINLVWVHQYMKGPEQPEKSMWDAIVEYVELEYGMSVLLLRCELIENRWRHRCNTTLPH